MIARLCIATLLVGTLLAFCAVGHTFAQTTRTAIDEQTLERLTSGPAPDAEIVRLLFDDLKREPLIREAAIRRLMRYPAVAAPVAVDLLAGASLSTRTAILDLLRGWHAPLDGIDAWQSDSLTPARLHAMRDWAASIKENIPSTRPATISTDEISAARTSIARMLSVSPEEARVIRERLARFGESLLPEVYAQLHAAAGDEPHRRLTALRYRLVASDRLALSWPDVLERLASGQTRARVAALDELATRVTSSEQRLLLELFSDPDPFVRERALRLLQSSGGEAVTGAMAKLLADPEANVRAAVLKQLIESPPPEIQPTIIEYVERETDADLVAQAARVLRSLKTPEAAQCLAGLIGHQSWRVRAEAIDGIKDLSAQLDPATRAAVYMTVISALDDEDGFVISRAVAALHDAKLAAAIEPMARAAEKHPEIAGDVVSALIDDNTMAAQALTYLKEFCGNTDPRVRAAGIAGLAAAAPRECGAVVEAGLRDSDARVRIASANAMFDSLCRLRSGARPGGRQTIWVGETESDTEKATDPLERFRSGPSQPKYLPAAVALLDPMLRAESPSDRAAAALAMIAAGREETGLAALESAVRDAPALQPKLVAAMPWLQWDARLSLFRRIIARHPDSTLMSYAVSALAASRDARGAAVLWQLLAENVPVETLDSVIDGLRKIYFGNQYYNPQQIPEARKKQAHDDATSKLTGSEHQRTTALVILLTASQEEVANVAQQILDDPKSGEWLRMDALQVRLLSQDESKSEAEAVKLVADPVLSKVAIPFLAMQDRGIEMLRGHIYLYAQSRGVMQTGGQPIAVAAPAALPIDQLSKAIANPDERLAAMAGYLLALTGNRAGYKKLEDYWRGRPTDDDWRRLMYRAIAAMNDDAMTPVLEEIYTGYRGDNWRMREFYWTIRSMTGPNVLKLRQRIRDEVGMQQLQ